MNRNDARLIAEEIYKLIRKDLPNMVQQSVQQETDEWLGTKEAAEYMGVSVGYVRKYIDEIPHSKVHGINKFRKSALMKYLSR